MCWKRLSGTGTLIVFWTIIMHILSVKKMMKIGGNFRTAAYNNRNSNAVGGF
jgi:hypothetical protein